MSSGKDVIVDLSVIPIGKDISLTQDIACCTKVTAPL